MTVQAKTVKDSKNTFHKYFKTHSKKERRKNFNIYPILNSSIFQNLVMDSHETKTESKNQLVLKVLLEGLYDTESHLSKLQGMHHILKYIWGDVKNFWQAHITLPDPDANWKDYWRDYHDTASLILGPSVTFAAPMGHIDNFRAEHQVDYPGFPAPTGTNINMMPFICRYTFEHCKLPDFIRPYWDLIEMCLKHHHSREPSSFHWPRRFSSDLGKVYYLTIQESEVEPGQSQRRPGLHVDCPGWVKVKSANEDQVRKGSGFSRKLNCFGWGTGLRACHVFNLPTEIKMSEQDLPKENMFVTFGGIYNASNVPNSTRVWNCAVDGDGEIIGEHGDIEHMRSALGDLEEEGEVEGEEAKMGKRGETSIFKTPMQVHAPTSPNQAIACSPPLNHIVNTNFKKLQN